MHGSLPMGPNENPLEYCNVLLHCFQWATAWEATETLRVRDEANWSQKKEGVLTSSQALHPLTHQETLLGSEATALCVGWLIPWNTLREAGQPFISGKHWCWIRPRITAVTISDNCTEVKSQQCTDVFIAYRISKCIITQSHNKGKIPCYTASICGN